MSLKTNRILIFCFQYFLFSQKQHNFLPNIPFFQQILQLLENLLHQILLNFQYILMLEILGLTKGMKKSNTLVWHKNKDKLLYFAHQLRSNIHPFTLITLTKPWCLLFWSKISMQKILRNAHKCHFRPTLANWLHQKA